VDGVLSGSNAVGGGTITAYSTPVWIGSHGNLTSERLEGRVDEVRIHDQAVDPAELNLIPGVDPAPGQVADFAASDGEDGQSVLTWTNPSDGDLAQVVVQRKLGGYPTSHTDGTNVYTSSSPTAGGGVNTTDTGLTNGTTYYYAVFSRDTANQWNDTVTEGSNADTGRPSEPGAVELVGYWQLNEGSGSTASDSSGNGNDGTVVGASWTTSADGSGALSFDGEDDYVEVPNATSLNPASGLTLEAWVRLDTLSHKHVIVEKANTSHTPPYYQYSMIVRSSGDIQLSIALNGQFTWLTSTVNLVVGQW